MTPSLLHPLNIPNQKWEEISMDFIEGLPVSDGKNKIFIVVDRLTKYAHFITIKKKTLQRKLQRYSANIFINYTTFRKLLSVTGMPNLKGTFGRNCSTMLEPTST